MVIACWRISHAEEWNWEIGYRRPGFAHHHLSFLHVSDIDRERVRLYREAEIDANHREHTMRSALEERRDDDDGVFTASNPYAG